MKLFTDNKSKEKKVFTYGATTQGSIHDKNGKPMQDRSIQRWFGAGEENLLLVVSDGHGSDPYFRSDKGAELAIDVASKIVIDFINDFEYNTKWPDFVCRGTEMDRSNRDPYAESQFRHLFEMIVAEWREAVENDLSKNPPKDEEYINASTKHDNSVKEFYENHGESRLQIYGCTLIVAVRTPSYWMAFRIGDGTCECLDNTGNWFSPLPWDKQCEGNVTTSLCEFGAESFTYCFGRIIPTALFIASDGIDDNFGGVHDGITPIDQIEWFRFLLLEIAKSKFSFSEEKMQKQLDILRHYDDKSLRLWIESDNFDSILSIIKQQCKVFQSNRWQQCKDFIEQKQDEIAQLERDIDQMEKENENINVSIILLEDENNQRNEDITRLALLINKLKLRYERVKKRVDLIIHRRTRYEKKKSELENQVVKNNSKLQSAKQNTAENNRNISIKRTMASSYRRELNEVYLPLLSQIENRIKLLDE